MTEPKFYKLHTDLAARRDLPPGAKIILSVLVDRMGNNGFCWPGVRKLAEDSGMSVNGVLGSLRALESKKDIHIERRGSGRVNHYRLPASESAQESAAPKKVQRLTKCDSGAQLSAAQAPNRVRHNQTDQLNQTNSICGELSNLLYELIRSRKPDVKKPNLTVWAKHIDLMIRRDNRKPENIEAVIRWCQADDFWRNNILSTNKLREHFDTLELKMRAENDRTKARIRDFEQQKSSIGTVVTV